MARLDAQSLVAVWRSRLFFLYKGYSPGGSGLKLRARGIGIPLPMDCSAAWRRPSTTAMVHNISAVTFFSHLLCLPGGG